MVDVVDGASWVVVLWSRGENLFLYWRWSLCFVSGIFEEVTSTTPVRLFFMTTVGKFSTLEDERRREDFIAGGGFFDDDVGRSAPADILQSFNSNKTR